MFTLNRTMYRYVNVEMRKCVVIVKNEKGIMMTMVLIVVRERRLLCYEDIQKCIDAFMYKYIMDV